MPKSVQALKCYLQCTGVGMTLGLFDFNFP